LEQSLIDDTFDQWPTYDCVLVFVVPMFDILNIPCDHAFVFFILDELCFTATLDAVGDILRAHYKDMKNDVLFYKVAYTRYLGEVNMFSSMCKMFFLPTAVQKLRKSNELF